MKLQKMFNMVLACLLIISLATPTHATEVNNFTFQSVSTSLVTPYASNSFTVNISAKTELSADSSFSLSAGDKVTIQASYSPTSASIDFGLEDSSGTYYYFRATGGNINKTMEVPENGSYTLQIRNNSNTSVKAIGFVKY